MAVTTRRTALAFGVSAGVGLLAALAIAPAVASSVPAATIHAGGCSATAHIDSQWGSGTTGGEIITVTVVNTSPTSATKWEVNWALTNGQRVVSAWNTTITTSGTTATAASTPYNGALAVGASTSFGVQLAGTAPAGAFGCGNDAAVLTSPSSSNGPPTGADVTLTTADSQSTVTLTVGQTLGVSLSSEYRPPTATGTALTQLSAAGGYPTGQPVAALYRAVAPGTVNVSSQTDYACLHSSPPCLPSIKLWTVRVNVVNASPSGTGQTVTVGTAANRTTVNLRVGDTLLVSLPSNYDPAKLTPSGVLAQTDSAGGYPTGQPLVAHYLAVAPGQVDVATVTDGDCLHAATPCPSPQIPWTVHVVVTA